jgi:hypothetical protein
LLIGLACEAMAALVNRLTDMEPDTAIRNVGLPSTKYDRKTTVHKEPVTKGRIVGNQQKWDISGPEVLWLSRVGVELPEGPIVASSAFDGLGLHLLPTQ